MALKLVAHLGQPRVVDEVEVLVPEPVPGHAAGADEEAAEKEQRHHICRQCLHTSSATTQ